MMEASDILDELPKTSSTYDLHDTTVDSILEKQLRDTLTISETSKRASEDIREAEFGDTLLVINKSDLLHDAEKNIRLESFVRKHNEAKTKEKASVCLMSCETQDGVDNFLEILRGQVETL